MAKPESVFLRTRRNLEISVVANLRLMTPYVLLEQEQWFENEINFVERCVDEGQGAIDVGANHGVYATLLASALGPAGYLACFEPSPNTAAHLARTIERNKLSRQTALHQVALSNRPGTANFMTHENSELNQLVSEATDGTHTVPVDILDTFLPGFGDRSIDFIKLDAEGEEARILSGAKQLLTTHDPLLMTELLHGKSVNSELLSTLKEKGYSLYRLIPGIGILAPLGDAEKNKDQLNIFACSTNRAAKLMDKELLTHKATHRTSGNLIDSLLFSQDPLNRADDRWAALSFCLEKLSPESKTLSLEEASLMVRAAIDCARNDIAFLGAKMIMSRLDNGERPHDPVANLHKDFGDGLIDHPNHEQLFIMALTVFEKIRQASSYFGEPISLPFLERFANSPFFTPELERRRQLMRNRTGQQNGLIQTAILKKPGPHMRNSRYWKKKSTFNQ